jgi:excisionase family DNA binding protein
MGKAKGPRRRERKQPLLPEGLLTTVQATRELGVSAATLRRWAKDRKVDAMKVGKQLRFRLGDLRRMVTLAASNHEATPSAPSLNRMAEAALEKLCSPDSARRFRELHKADVANLPQATPTTMLLANILAMGVDAGCTDLHFEPSEEMVVIRQRVDGLLSELLTIPKALYVEIVAQLKQLAELDKAEKFRPQDGRAMMNLSGRAIEYRLSIMPAMLGEVVAIRLFDRAAQLPELSKQGFEAGQLEQWRRIIHGPYGLIVVNGPTGAGKTTLIYGSLTELTGPGVKIMTAEDPIMFALPGVSQVQLRPDIGLDYVSAARHIGRQAANVIYIREIRDRETAEILCAQAMTGHLVISTMHANDAVLCIRRLIEMGVQRNILAGSLTAVTAQRLVRSICSHCKEEYRPSEREFIALGVPRDQQQGKFYRGKGCDRCRGLGYRGRVAVIELLELNDRVREGIFRGDDSVRLREAARPAGFRRMSEIATDKIMRGETTIEEVVRAGLAAQAAE